MAHSRWSMSRFDQPLATHSRSGHPDVMQHITHDNDTFTITGKQWSGTYPLSDLPKCLRFYRRQKADFPKAGTAYDATIEGLEALAKELGVRVDPT